jgi:hypothetical protein
MEEKCGKGLARGESEASPYYRTTGSPPSAGKRKNEENRQQHNEYLIAELREIVTPSSFALPLCTDKLEAASE